MQSAVAMKMTSHYGVLFASPCQKYRPYVDVFVYCPSLISFNAVSIPTIAEFCG